MLFAAGSVILNRLDWYLDCNLPPPPPFYLGEVIRNETYPFPDTPAKMFPNNLFRGFQEAPRNSDTAALPRGQFSGPPKRFQRVRNGLVTVWMAKSTHRWLVYLRGLRLPLPISDLASALAQTWPITPQRTTDFFSWISFESFISNIRGLW